MSKYTNKSIKTQTNQRKIGIYYVVKHFNNVQPQKIISKK